MTAPTPATWLSRDYLRPRPGGAIRVQRRVLRGYGQRRSRASHLASEFRHARAWRRGEAAQALVESRERTDRFATVTGLSQTVVSRRLEELARHGIHPQEALSYGLVLDGRRWQDFVTDRHRAWNLAAGGRRTRPGISILGDKRRTAERLAEAGVPVVDSVLLPAGRPAGPVVRAFLEQHREAFVKPNTGSRGRASFHLSPDGVRAYQDLPILGLDDWLNDPPEEDLLLQTSLRTHPGLAGDAATYDVVTLRVVTRDLGGGPELFSAALEVPRDREPDAPARYSILRVDPSATVSGPAAPPWIVGPDDAAHATWVRRGIQHAAQSMELARLAHSAMPPVFAIAWDVALTDAGPIFLEGNGGFGTRVPQWLSGGLLAGLA